MRQTLIANLIDTAGKEAQYDEQSRRLLSMTEILAWILKSCVDEFKEYDIPFIMKNCFVGKPIISQMAVHQDMPDMPEQAEQTEKADQSEQPAVNQYVETMNSEDVTIKEHTVVYDIRFRAYVPKTNEIIELIVDLEIQKDSSSILRIIRRGIYYVSRMISAQFGTEFQGEHYEKIKKVISIWICPATAQYRQDSIVEFSIKPNTLHGDFEVAEKDVDLQRVLIIGLTNRETENRLIRLLSVYLSDIKTPEEKKKILEEEFDIKMTEEMEKEIKKMYALSEALKDRTRTETWQKAQTRIATNLLRGNNSIPFVAQMTELSEDVVRSIAKALKIESKK